MPSSSLYPSASAPATQPSEPAANAIETIRAGFVLAVTVIIVTMLFALPLMPLVDAINDDGSDNCGSSSSSDTAISSSSTTTTAIISISIIGTGESVKRHTAPSYRTINGAHIIPRMSPPSPSSPPQSSVLSSSFPATNRNSAFSNSLKQQQKQQQQQRRRRPTKSLLLLLPLLSMPQHEFNEESGGGTFHHHQHQPSLMKHRSQRVSAKSMTPLTTAAARAPAALVLDVQVRVAATANSINDMR